jgi:hypothetical protein
MKPIDYRPNEPFPIKNPPFDIYTTITTKYHYIVIQADATKEDPWGLLLP